MSLIRQAASRYPLLLNCSILSPCLYFFPLMLIMFFFTAIVQSYALLNPLTFHFSGALMQNILSISKDMFVIAVKLAAPIMAVMLFTNVGLGIVARTVPQINIFIVGMPLQIAIGLIFLGLTAPMFIKLTSGYFLGFETRLATLLRLM
ncbi:MAG: flagellar biosynthetic protein FliR [Smithellaceae bacterium]